MSEDLYFGFMDSTWHCFYCKCQGCFKWVCILCNFFSVSDIYLFTFAYFIYFFANLSFIILCSVCDCVMFWCCSVFICVWTNVLIIMKLNIPTVDTAASPLSGTTSSLAIQWQLGWMPTAAQDREVLNLKYPKVYSLLYGAQRAAACEEVTFLTVHQGWQHVRN